MNGQRVGIGVIGAGFISNYHLSGLLCVQSADVKIICDTNKNQAEAQARRFRVACTTAGVDEVLEREDVQAVLILTPNNTHHELALRAAEAGKHMMMQKPIARTVKEAEAMISAAAKAGVLLVPSLMHRFMDETMKAKELIEQGYIGRPVGAHIRNGVPAVTHAAWFFNPDIMGGGAVIDIGVHGIDLLRYLVGEPTQLTAFIGTLIQSRQMDSGESVKVSAEDSGSVVYRFDNNAIATQDISWIQFKGSDRFSAEIFGDEGTIYLRHQFAPLAFASNRVDSAGAWIVPDLPNNPFGYTQHKLFVDAVRKNEYVAVRPEDGLNTIRIVKAIYESASTGKSIQLSATDR